MGQDGRVGILLALLSSATWGSADFLGGLLSLKIKTSLVVGASQTGGLVAVTLVALATGAFAGDAGWVGWALLAGVTGTTGLLAFYVALASGTMGIVSPIAALGVLVPVAVGLFQGERPGVVTSIGVLVALLGAVAASGPELRGSAGARPVALAMVAGVMFGLALTFIALGAAHDSVMTLWGMRLTSVTGFAVAGAVALARGGRATVGRRDVALIACVGVGDATANLFFALASTRGYISVTSVLASLYPVMTVLLARYVLEERLLRVQTIGVVAALLGVVL